MKRNLFIEHYNIIVTLTINSLFNMNLFDVIHAKTSLNAIIGSIRLSLHDLRDKHEHRKDLIETLEKYEIWMSETRDTLSAMEDENKQLIKRLAQYHTEYLKLKRENNQLNELI